MADELAQILDDVVGIDPELRVYGGYDYRHYSACAPDADNVGPQMPAAEKIALADAMIERWQRYRDAAKG